MPGCEHVMVIVDIDRRKHALLSDVVSSSTIRVVITTSEELAQNRVIPTVPRIARQ